MKLNLDFYLNNAIEAARQVQPLILSIFNSSFDIEIKEDNSPVTTADKMADQFLINFLKESFPTHSFLTEESKHDLSRLKNDFVWIIDPIDGTKEFTRKQAEFTTNIALSYKGEIIVGVVLAPVLNELFYASKGGGAYCIKGNIKKKIEVSNKLKDLTVLCSRYHFKETEQIFIDKNKDVISTVLTVGASLKACRIAEGKAEISYRSTDGTKEWDIAAPQLIVEEAGGFLLKPDGSKYEYNREDVKNREGYIIINKKEHLGLL